MGERLRETVAQISTEVKARAYWWFLDHGLRLNIAGGEQLEPVRAHVAGGGSVVVIYNHESLIDPGVVMSLMQKSLSGLIRRQTWLASSKFYPDLYERFDKDVREKFESEIEAHKREAMGQEAPLIHAIAAVNRVEMVPVVQSHRIGEGAFKRLNVGINLEAFRTFAGALREGGTLAGISPEGTRSPDGLLAEAQAGIQHIFRDSEVADRTVIVPLALTGTRDVHSVKHGWRSTLAPVVAGFGPAFWYRDIQRDAEIYQLLPKDLLMLRLARLLPAQKLGYYGRVQFSQYLNGDVR